MESSGGGELGDIIRASSRSGGSPGTRHLTDRWQLPSVPTSFPSPTEAPSSGFFDPFSNLCRDPLLQELPATSGAIFHSPDDSILGLVKTGTSARSDGDNHDEHNASGVGGGGGSDGGGGSTSTTLPTFQNKILGEEAARPWNIFSRFLQISPTANKAASPTLARRMRPSPILVGGHDTVKSSDNPLACCNPPNHAGLQISPPSPQAPGIKRRKSQAKKVVCIPAPAAAGSRPSGEVIPSDLWAWRKYGQKPIKGSPYPRGYYRCSSSKGCSARKQVERSRIDPNMLVITYTSEHNHPWPTQRNALAGSTRAQPARTNTYGTSTKGDPLPYQKLEEQREECMGTHATGAMKEEGAAVLLPTGKATVDSRDNNDGHDHLDRVFQQNCKDVLFPEAFRSDDDFFSDLGGLESDPMELVFSKGFLEDTPEEEEEEEDRKKGMKTTLDPFGFD